MKDEEAYEIDPDRACYVSELTDSAWCHRDFLELCNNQEEFARMLFSRVDWQSPSTLAEEMFRDMEWDTAVAVKRSSIWPGRNRLPALRRRTRPDGGIAMRTKTG